MSIVVKKSGLLSTVQDLGRSNFRRFGINPNGAMDRRAARLINILLGNAETEPVLEMHFPAPILEFEKAAVIALGGADFGAILNKTRIENWRPVFAEKGDVLEFPEKISGNRAYLAVKGGFQIEKWRGSASTNLAAQIGGFDGRSLRKDDKIIFNSRFQIPDSRLSKNFRFPYTISKNLIPPYSSHPTVRVVAGAEFEQLTGLSEKVFLSGDFTVSKDSNRMGFRLRGEPLFLHDKIELVSSAVDFGTIQLLPDGQIIMLMADCQTSGGYPRIAHVASRDLPILAQLGANDKVNFALISVEEAEDLMLDLEKDLNLLKIACSFKNIPNQ